MDFFAEQYKALFTLPNVVYSDVKAGLQPFFITEKSRGLFPADVVCVEPEVSKGTNQVIRDNGGHGSIECEFLLITSVKQLGAGQVAHGFVRLITLPGPVHNIIDALNRENKYLRNAVKRLGGHADLIAIGTE